MDVAFELKPSGPIHSVLYYTILNRLNPDKNIQYLTRSIYQPYERIYPIFKRNSMTVYINKCILIHDDNASLILDELSCTHGLKR